jgi:glycosyltransferase involved in cell wall biosynthesis
VDDPLDAAGFAARLREVLGSPRLREDLRRRGLARAAGFSWRAAAAAHLETYRRCAAEASFS